jgi:hypothetical protein
MAGQLRVRIRYREHATAWFDYLFASPGELADLAAGTGWRIARRLDDGGPSTWQCSRRSRPNGRRAPG